jgi:hypothetical protein
MAEGMLSDGDGDNGSEFKEFSDFELKAAEVLVKGTSDSGLGLLNILLDIFDSNRQSISEGDCKVRPGYAYDKFYLNRVSGEYDMSLFGLIHHIMYEDDLYSIFLNERQMEVVSQIVNEEQEGIYRPITDEESDEYEEDEFANYTTGRIYTIAAKYTFKYLSEYGRSECNLSAFEDENYDINGNKVDVDEVLWELSGPFSKVDELKKVWGDNKDRWEDGLDEDNFNFVKVVKKITEDSLS